MNGECEGKGEQEDEGEGWGECDGEDEVKGTVTQNIFSLETSPNECMDIWNYSSLQKCSWKIGEI